MSASLKRHRLVHAHPRIYCICKRRMASAFLRNFLLRRGDRNERASILRREINQNENTERNSECAVVQRDRNKIGKNRRERERGLLPYTFPFPRKLYRSSSLDGPPLAENSRKFPGKFLASRPSEFSLESVPRTSETIPLPIGTRESGVPPSEATRRTRWFPSYGKFRHARTENLETI